MTEIKVGLKKYKVPISLQCRQFCEISCKLMERWVVPCAVRYVPRSLAHQDGLGEAAALGCRSREDLKVQNLL